MTAPAVDAARVRWSLPVDERATALRTRPLLVMLHGYGSHAGDLFGLVPHLPERFVVASVEGLEPAGPGWAWFPLGVDSQTGDLTRDPAHVEAATASLLTWCDEQRSLNPDIQGIHVLGFSQGGAMSLELIRRRPRDFVSATVLAGFALPAESETLRAADTEMSLVSPPVFWGRDPNDPVISRDIIAFTAEWLPAHADLEAREYQGVGHGISLDEVEDVVAFLDRVAGRPNLVGAPPA